MAFDLGTWVIGYSLSRLVTSTLDKAKMESFSNELNSIVKEWSENLPDGLNVHPEAIFPRPNLLDDRNNRHLDLLREKILVKELPSLNDWSQAIFEQWKIIKSTIGDGAQSFFLLDETDALVHIDSLANSLYQKSKLNTDLFQVKVLSELELIKNRIDSLKPKESEQTIIQSKLSIIIELKNSISILSNLWPLNPFFTRDVSDYNDIHSIIEETILNIHLCYSLILPYCDSTGISENVKSIKDRFLSSLNSYLELVDKFYQGDMKAIVNLLDNNSTLDDVDENRYKWKNTLIMMKEYLKIELEKE